MQSLSYWLSEVPLVDWRRLTDVVRSGLENTVDTLSACRLADALEGSMVTAMASRDCEGQSEPIKEADVERKEKKGSNQIVLLVTFLPALPKNVCLLCILYFILPLSDWYASL